MARSLNPSAQARRAENRARVEAAKPDTAHNSYLDRHSSCQALIRKLQAKLETHAMREATNQANWCNAGDLGHVEELLQQIDDFLS